MMQGTGMITLDALYDGRLRLEADFDLVCSPTKPLAAYLKGSNSSSSSSLNLAGLLSRLLILARLSCLVRVARFVSSGDETAFYGPPAFVPTASCKGIYSCFVFGKACFYRSRFERSGLDGYAKGISF